MVLLRESCQADTAFKQNFEHRQERIWPKTDQTKNYWWWKAETKNTKTPDTPGAEKIQGKTNVSPCRVSVACRLPHWDKKCRLCLEFSRRRCKASRKPGSWLPGRWETLLQKFHLNFLELLNGLERMWCWCVCMIFRAVILAQTAVAHFDRKTTYEIETWSWSNFPL